MFKDNTIKSVQDYFNDKLGNSYSKREIQIFVELCLDSMFGLSKTDIILNETRFSESELLQFRAVTKRLKMYEPIQYILGIAHFYGYDFKVMPSVLIPRPETEELVDLIVNSKPFGRIVDIGTGSGIIPISLGKTIEKLELHAIDISEEALTIAIENAKLLDVKVEFHQLDILVDDLPMNEIDVIVSNPPYVLESDKKEMMQQVLGHEPDLALFVEDETPLIFYSRIVDLALKTLRKGGVLFFEIHEKFGAEMIALCSDFEKVDLLKDLQGKDRFIKAVK